MFPIQSNCFLRKRENCGSATLLKILFYKLLHASEGKDECTEINLYDVVKKNLIETLFKSLVTKTYKGFVKLLNKLLLLGTG